MNQIEVKDMSQALQLSRIDKHVAKLLAPHFPSSLGGVATTVGIFSLPVALWTGYLVLSWGVSVGWLVLVPAMLASCVALFKLGGEMTRNRLLKTAAVKKAVVRSTYPCNDNNTLIVALNIEDYHGLDILQVDLAIDPAAGVVWQKGCEVLVYMDKKNKDTCLGAVMYPFPPQALKLNPDSALALAVESPLEAPKRRAVLYLNDLFVNSFLDKEHLELGLEALEKCATLEEIRHVIKQSTAPSLKALRAS